MTDKFRIAMVAACPFPYPRGTPVRIYRMAEILSEFGHEVHVITYHIGQQKQYSPFIIHRIPKLNFYKKMTPGPSVLKLLALDPLLILKTLDLYKKYSFDIIHAHHVEGFLSALPLRFLSGIPVIFDMHTLLSTELQYYRLHLPQRWITKISGYFDGYLPGYADHVISVTDEIKNELIKKNTIAPEKISVIPNGIEFEHFSQVKTKQKPSKDTIILGFAGNSAEYQGIEIMMESLGILAQSDHRIHLHLYSNESFDQYKMMIKKLHISSRVEIMHSDFNSLPEQLSRADILLNPRPDGAGHPLKLLNYMAAGKPIVTFAVSGHFLTHGETAWIIKESTPDAFADGIKHLVANRGMAAEMGRNAQLVAGRHFSWRSRGEEIIQIYRKLAKV